MIGKLEQNWNKLLRRYAGFYDSEYYFVLAKKGCRNRIFEKRRGEKPHKD